ncbi:MAG TPA: glycoside hydrolase family 9 protein [Acidimicrobiales bacterium]
MRRSSGRSLVLAVVLAAVLVVPGPGVAAQTITGHVRVNQVGYDTAAPKRAFLMTDAAVTGGTFRVRTRSGRTVFSGPIGSNQGSWSSDFPFVYALDFDSVTARGRYVVEVSGPVTATSPVFKLDTPARLYAPLLANATSFYEAQRDGPDVVPAGLNRQPAHLNDGSATVYKPPRFDEDDLLRGDLVPVRRADPRDVSGGWFDAGDYIKGTETISYTLDMLLVAVRDHPTLLGPDSPANLAAEARFGLDWLQKMWDDPTGTLYYQVGLGEGNADITGDHDPWRLPEGDDTFGADDPASRYIRNRPAFRAASPGSPISPNQAGRFAGALALCYQVYKATDPAYADPCLLSAQHIFDLADTTPTGDLVTFSPFSFYPETEWRSDLELAAAELYHAVAAGDLPPGLPHADPSFYLRKAAHWARAYINSPDDAVDTLNLYDVSAVAHYDLHRAIDQAGDRGELRVSQDELVADLKKQLDNAGAQAATDPFGFGFPYAAFDGTSHGQGLAITASFYDELTGTTTYAEFGRRQLGVILGSNAWGASFIVGAGTSFPRCIHHQVANLNGSLDGRPPILLGAAVNGTNSADVFEDLGVPDEARVCPADGSNPYALFDGQGARYLDDVTSWPSSEPALDFVATTPLALARQIAGKP